MIIQSLDFSGGRRGLVGLFVMYMSHGAKGRGFESRPFRLFFATVRRFNYETRREDEKTSNYETTRENEKGGSGEEEMEGPAGVSGKGYEKGIRFVSRKRRLNG